MLRLQLVVYDGKRERDLGELRIVRRPGEYGETTGNYDVKLDGQVVGCVERYERKHGAWKLAQLALNGVYAEVLNPAPAGNTVGDHHEKYPKQRIKPYRHDGMCNGLTQRGPRCSTPSAPGSPFCLGHTWQSSYD